MGSLFIARYLTQPIIVETCYKVFKKMAIAIK